MDNKKINNAKYLITDLIQGDDSVSKREDFIGLTLAEIKSAVNLIISNPSIPEKEREYLLKNLWRVNYVERPPETISEFLTEEWIGPIAEDIYPHIKRDLEIFFAPFGQKRHLLLAAPIGYGKSFMSAISILYILTHCNLMRDPKKFFGISRATSIVAVLGSFTLAKAKQLLLKPFLNILTNSPKYRRVKMEDKVSIIQKEERSKGGDGRIVWTTASKMEGAIQFSNDIHILICSDLSSLLGLSIIAGVLSELSFFIDRGVSQDTIWRFYTDLRGRIDSRFQGHYFARSIMDSSPNDIEKSPIDRYIFEGEASQDPQNMIITAKHWEVFPEKYEIWQKTGETFPVFKGSKGNPPKILQPEEVSNYLESDIFYVPVDLKRHFKMNLLKSIKDFCGYPSGSSNKLIDDYNELEGIFFDNLINEYSYITAPANENPKGLIWNKIYKKFFNFIDGKFRFYRYPDAPRYISIDQSYINDMTGIAMCHSEVDKEGNIVYVLDFSIVIKPTKEKINLEAIYEFIMDLRLKGNITFEKITFDQFQSEDTIQKLERDFLPVERYSVDREMGAYNILLSLIKTKRLKCGKNIFLKNNLKSLILVDLGRDDDRRIRKRKIDHTKGEIVYDDGGDWKTSLMGINAKDCSDSVAACVFQCQLSEKVPCLLWEEEKNTTPIAEKSEKIKSKVLSYLYDKYGVK